MNCFWNHSWCLRCYIYCFAVVWLLPLDRNFKRKTLNKWVDSKHIISSLLGKILTYFLYFCAWTWCWMFWLAHIRGYFIAGSLSLNFVCPVFLYFSYAVISSTVGISNQRFTQNLWFYRPYGGSSPSFRELPYP